MSHEIAELSEDRPSSSSSCSGALCSHCFQMFPLTMYLLKRLTIIPAAIPTKNSVIVGVCVCSVSLTTFMYVCLCAQSLLDFPTLLLLPRTQGQPWLWWIATLSSGCRSRRRCGIGLRTLCVEHQARSLMRSWIVVAIARLSLTLGQPYVVGSWWRLSVWSATLALVAV